MRKKSSPVILDDSDEDLAPKKRSKFTSDLEDMKEDIADIAAVVRDIKELDKTSAVPLAMKKLITDAFKCKLCLQAPMRPPPYLHQMLQNPAWLQALCKRLVQWHWRPDENLSCMQGRKGILWNNGLERNWWVSNGNQQNHASRGQHSWYVWPRMTDKLLQPTSTC